MYFTISVESKIVLTVYLRHVTIGALVIKTTEFKQAILALVHVVSNYFSKCQMYIKQYSQTKTNQVYRANLK